MDEHLENSATRSDQNATCRGHYSNGSKEQSGSTSRSKRHSSPDFEPSPKRTRDPMTRSEDRADEESSLGRRSARPSRRKTSATQDRSYISWKDVPEAEVSRRLPDKDETVISSRETSKEETQPVAVKKEPETAEEEPPFDPTIESKEYTGDRLTTPDDEASISSWISETDPSIERNHQRVEETKEILERLESNFRKSIRKITALVGGAQKGKLRDEVKELQENLERDKADLISVASK
ncbi:hypothetical protein PTTG_12173 [Puccinia triticina 1-1 BBBD Race 1]|uniref:Uncharacterized protein n=1 Tax=Puccinia triticina (isolate 1-1 / race 1 (BBBD)) TaxID=630390 RepID=A0A180GHH1_PUCT1|nr:hypothetical protein PTTG_12173 [Puccinia triticina 1-1 BBBD Race 1]